jgi:hypothetical protein
MSTLLIKFPSRERPEQLCKALDLYVRLLDEPQNVRFMFTFDSDDPSLPKYLEYVKAVTLGKGISYEISVDKSSSKVHAINRDMEASGEWEFLLLASDDMLPEVQGYDTRIRQARSPCMPVAIWLNAGDQPRIATLMAMERPYFDAFGYIYHPEYLSLWCDNEWTEVAQQTGCVVKIEEVLIRNVSPDWGGKAPRDALYRRNNRLHDIDHKTYLRRKAADFPK